MNDSVEQPKMRDPVEEWLRTVPKGVDPADHAVYVIGVLLLRVENPNFAKRRGMFRQDLLACVHVALEAGRLSAERLQQIYETATSLRKALASMIRDHGIAIVTDAKTGAVTFHGSTVEERPDDSVEGIQEGTFEEAAPEEA